MWCAAADLLSEVHVADVRLNDNTEQSSSEKVLICSNWLFRKGLCCNYEDYINKLSVVAGHC